MQYTLNRINNKNNKTTTIRARMLEREDKPLQIKDMCL
jgi:hypothetical protein